MDQRSRLDIFQRLNIHNSDRLSIINVLASIQYSTKAALSPSTNSSLIIHYISDSYRNVDIYVHL